jgi:ABC-type multidrug transport system fused ATPase/permease subunit
MNLQNNLNKDDMYDNEHKKTVNLFQIINETVLENKKILLSLIILIVAFWMQDVYFTSKLGTFTSDIDAFIKNLSANSVFILFLPMIFAECLFYVSNILLAKSAPHIKLSVMQKLIDNAIESAKTTKKQINVNELTLNIKKTNEIEIIYDLITSYIVPTILIAIGVAYTFYKTNKPFGLVALIIFIVFFIVLYFIHERSINSSCKIETDTTDYFDAINDTTSNIDTVITSANKHKELNKLELNKKIVAKSQYAGDVIASNVLIQANMVSILFVIIMIALALYLYSIKILNTQEVTAISIMLVLFLQYCDSMLYKIKLHTQCIGKMYELQNYFRDFEIKKQNQNLFIMQPTDKGEIKLENVTVAHKNKVVFNNLNMVFSGSKKTILLGPNGIGKSTVLKIISGLFDYSGKITIDNKDIAHYNYDSVLKYIDYIQQQPKLFNRSIYENINYGSNYTKEQIYKFIENFGLKSFFDNFPDKLDTIAGNEGNKLSGGQRQIIAVVRALVQNKKIILLDEPTSAIDGTIKKMFINLINKIQNKTIIIVTHDKSLVAIADTIIDISSVN